MSEVLSVGMLAAGLVPLVILRARSDAPGAPRRSVNRDALVALGRLQQERALTMPAPPAEIDGAVVSLDAYRERRSRAAHPAGRGRLTKSRGA
jgi:hypothetical protein